MESYSDLSPSTTSKVDKTLCSSPKKSKLCWNPTIIRHPSVENWIINDQDYKLPQLNIPHIPNIPPVESEQYPNMASPYQISFSYCPEKDISNVKNEIYFESANNTKRNSNNNCTSDTENKWNNRMNYKEQLLNLNITNWMQQGVEYSEIEKQFDFASKGRGSDDIKDEFFEANDKQEDMGKNNKNDLL